MKKSNKLIEGLDRVVQAKYSVPAWLWVAVSLITGILILAVAIFAPLTAVEFLSALPLGGLLIGPIVIGGALVAMYGMARDIPKYVRAGSFVSFCVWLFVGFAFGATNILNVFILPLPMLIFWAYKYLASYVREQNGV